ncbi:hypothetical protein V1515DRAFT_614356 [Lipomyces mesembrius]
MKGRGRTPTPTNRSTASRPKDLKEMLPARDGRCSLVGRIMDDAGPVPNSPLPNGMATLQVAHIIPFSARRHATTHEAFDAFKFGLELPTRTLPSSVSRHFDGEELLFGQGPEQVALPSALLCNIQLAVGRVLLASGAAETIDNYS